MNKLDAGVKINAKELSSYECVACNSRKAKRMRDVHCTETTESGATMILFVIDETTICEWVFLLEKKGVPTEYILKLPAKLDTQFLKHNVQRLHADQGVEFASNELHICCEKHDIIRQFTNAYTPQENGIAERATGVVLPRIRAMLTTTHLPNLLWGEAL